jgi:hypothetical protein
MENRQISNQQAASSCEWHNALPLSPKLAEAWLYHAVAHREKPYIPMGKLFSTVVTIEETSGSCSLLHDDRVKLPKR